MTGEARTVKGVSRRQNDSTGKPGGRGTARHDLCPAGGCAVGVTRRSRSHSDRHSPVLDVGRPSQGMAQDEAVVSVGVEPAPSLVSDGDVAQRLARLELELGDDGVVLVDQSCKGVASGAVGVGAWGMSAEVTSARKVCRCLFLGEVARESRTKRRSTDSPSEGWGVCGSGPVFVVACCVAMVLCAVVDGQEGRVRRRGRGITRRDSRSNHGCAVCRASRHFRAWALAAASADWARRALGPGYTPSTASLRSTLALGVAGFGVDCGPELKHNRRPRCIRSSLASTTAAATTARPCTPSVMCPLFLSSPLPSPVFFVSRFILGRDLEKQLAKAMA